MRSACWWPTPSCVVDTLKQRPSSRTAALRTLTRAIKRARSDEKAFRTDSAERIADDSPPPADRGGSRGPRSSHTPRVEAAETRASSRWHDDGGSEVLQYERG